MGKTNFPNGAVFGGAVGSSAITGNIVPATGSSGYNPGCLFIKSATALGQATQWINYGTVS